MAEQLLDQVHDVVDGQIDFEGQKLCETVSTAFLIIVGIASFLSGYATQDIVLALKIGLAGTALCFLVVIPPWPFYKRNPVKWLPVGGQPTGFNVPQTVVVDENMFAKR